MILLPLGVFVTLLCHSDLAIQRNLRDEVETFYVAEAGVERALAEMQPGTSSDPLLAGNVSGEFPSAPLRYDVRVTTAGAGLLRIVSRGVGRNGTTKDVEALVARSRTPFTPAALYAEGDISGLDLGSRGFVVSGLDHRRSDSPGAATGTESAVAAVGSPNPAAEAALRKRLAGRQEQVVGNGGSGSIATTAPFALQRYASSLPNLPQAVPLAPGEATAEALGTDDRPQVTSVPGDLSITGSLTGNGILVVRGALHVSGSFAFEGLVLAMGGIVFEPASTVTISGALWRTLSTDTRLELGGSGGIVYSASAMAAVDHAFPNLLPYATVVVGRQEDS